MCVVCERELTIERVLIKLSGGEVKKSDST